MRTRGRTRSEIHTHSHTERKTFRRGEERASGVAARPLFVVRASLHLALLPRGVRRGVGGIGIGGASGQPPRSTSLSASLTSRGKQTEVGRRISIGRGKRRRRRRQRGPGRSEAPIWSWLGVGRRRLENHRWRVAGYAVFLREKEQKSGRDELRECNFILAQIYKETMMRIIIKMILIKTNIGEMNRCFVLGGWDCSGRVRNVLLIGCSVESTLAAAGLPHSPLPPSPLHLHI